MLQDLLIDAGFGPEAVLVRGSALGVVQRPTAKLAASKTTAIIMVKSFDMIKTSSVNGRKSPATGCGGASYFEERGWFSGGS
jgi:hypothetical protein